MSARSPRYYCETCRDSGLVLTPGKIEDGIVTQWQSFEACTACDGRSRLCGEVDEPTPETPTLDELRNIKHGGPA